MKYSDALRDYIAAYNTKQQLESDPLNEPGVLAQEAASLMGTIDMSRVQSYDEAVTKIGDEMPVLIAAQQAIMDNLTPIIRAFFEVVATKVNFVYSDDRTQRISVSEGLITVSNVDAT